MKSKFLIYLIISFGLLCCTKLFSQPITFQKVYGGTNSDFGLSVIQTNDGGYLMSGFTFSFGSGAGDVYLIKTNSIGDTLWTKTYGGIQLEYAYAIQTSDGGYAFAGESYSFGLGTPASPNVLLVKLNSYGDTLWSKVYGGLGEENINSIRKTNDNGFILVGYTTSFGAGTQDVYLIKTDSLGNVSWSKTYGGNGMDFGSDVQQTIDGGYIILGETDNYGPPNLGNMYAIKTNSLGDTLWTKTFGNGNESGGCVVQTSDTGYAFLGTSNSYGAGNSDCYLVKTNVTGNILWSKTYGGSFDDHGINFREYRDSVSGLTKYYYITGYSPGFESNTSWGNYHSFLIQTNLLGIPYWTKIYGTGPSDYSYYVDLTNDIGVVMSGHSQDFGSGAEDVYLVKTDENGVSGCYEIPNTIITTSPPSIYYSGGIVGNPATVTSNAPVVIGNTNTIVTTLCQTPLGVNSPSEISPEISINPNPTTRNIVITNAEENATVIICNSFGGIVFAGTSNGDKMEINLENISSGIYFVLINSGSEVISKKFIKE